MRSTFDKQQPRASFCKFTQLISYSWWIQRRELSCRLENSQQLLFSSMQNIFGLVWFYSVIKQYIHTTFENVYTIHNATPPSYSYFHTILMVHFVICICLAFFLLPSFFHKILPVCYKTLPMYHHLRTQPHTISGPSPVFVVCGCLDEAERGKTGSQTTAYVSNSPLQTFPLLSWPPHALPSLLSSPRCVSFSLHVHQIAH